MIKIRDWLYVGKYVHTTNLALLRQAHIGAMLQLAEHVTQPQITNVYLEVDDGVALPDGALKKGVDFVRALATGHQTEVRSEENRNGIIKDESSF
ncbi:MAG: hypothetical protein RLP44_23400 [Aggregatilineales bacterium]